jgi:endonuclease/exonuclease/phosphatase family metal-dependent hydrolase
MNPQPAPNSATLTCATANLLNLANPGRVFYENQEPYSQHEFERKIEWLGGRIAALNADVLAVQEVWDEAALKGAVSRSGLRYSTVAVPGAENNASANGAQGTPRVGIVTRLEVEQLQSFSDFPPELRLSIPGLGEHHRFERPPLLARLRMKHGQSLHVLTAHLKSKRPKYLQDAQGKPLEDRDDDKITALATLRSLMMRGAESAALRHIVIDLLHRSREPLILMGDLNDGPHSVSTQIIAATSEVAYDKAARDTALWNAFDVQGEMALKRNVAYSHVHQGFPEVLDQIFVSEEFLRAGRHSIGDVRRVDYFNDHLHEGRDRSRSDHGFVRAVLRLDLPPTA